jgi:outer membrane protein OmpA-like peptidoglycan-associated protein
MEYAMVRWVSGLVLFFSVHSLSAQKMDTIRLMNPSFEDRPGSSRPPREWQDCGFPEETPPDVQPAGGFNVTRPAHEGKTYMGMVTRENDTWESVSQRLSMPVEAGNCYTFSIYLCRSDTYISPLRNSNKGTLSFTTPIKLRVWGGNWLCHKQELLGETPVVSNVEWQRYGLKLEPKGNYQFIILEAFYKTPVFFPYNGNILIDNASDIIQIPCSQDLPNMTSIQDEKPTAIASNRPAKKEPADTRKVNGKSEARKPERILALSRETLKKGSIITIERLYFESDSASIPSECFAVLDEIHEFLVAHEDIIIEIGGHTNSIPRAEYCDRLSLERARSVANYLADKGIPKRRLFYKGYGKRKPIADDGTAEGKRKNQRVEIRILYMKEE